MDFTQATRLTRASITMDLRWEQFLIIIRKMDFSHDHGFFDGIRYSIQGLHSRHEAEIVFDIVPHHELRGRKSVFDVNVLNPLHEMDLSPLYCRQHGTLIWMMRNVRPLLEQIRFVVTAAGGL